MTNLSRDSLAALQLPSPNRGPYPDLSHAEHPRVLLADQDDDTRRLVSGRLRRDGCLVLEILDGRQLLAAVTAELARHRRGFLPVDLIIASEWLPGPTGLEVLGAVRGSRWPVPFIVLAGSATPGMRRKARRLGASATFERPPDLDRLMNAVALLVSP
ncbi:MAG TPA: response regulator [Kofleriaceae bacterium]|nr:response regulator [Kofleriaceae bacterium]